MRKMLSSFVFALATAFAVAAGEPCPEIGWLREKFSLMRFHRALHGNKSLQFGTECTVVDIGGDAATSLADPVPEVTVLEGVATVRIKGSSVSRDRRVTSPPEFVEVIYVENARCDIVALAYFTMSTMHLPLVFDVPADAGTLTAFTFSNRQGLFTSAPLTVSSVPQHPAPAACPKTHCFAANPEDRCSDLQYYFETALYRQKIIYGAPVPFNPGDTNVMISQLLKPRTPYVRFFGSFALVAMGPAGGSDEHIPYIAAMMKHGLRFLFAVDGDGKVVASTRLIPSDPPTLQFELPAGVKSITPYALSDETGFVRGLSYAVRPALTGPVNTVCTFQRCGGRRFEMLRCPNFESLRGDLKRDHAVIVSKNFPGFKAYRAEVQLLADHRARVLVSPRNPEGEGEGVYNIHVLNQEGSVVAMAVVAPPQQVSLEFAIPEYTTLLRPVLAHTRAGLIEGTSVSLPGASPHSYSPMCVYGSFWEDVPQVGGESCEAFNGLTHFLETFASEEAAHNQTQVLLDSLRVQSNGKEIYLRLPSFDLHNFIVTSKPETVTYIRAAYVQDQDSRIVAAGYFDPTSKARFQTDFGVDATELTAYFVDNRGGVLKGTSVRLRDTHMDKLQVQCRDDYGGAEAAAASGGCALPLARESLQRRAAGRSYSPHASNAALSSEEVQMRTPFLVHGMVTIGNTSSAANVTLAADVLAWDGSGAEAWTQHVRNNLNFVEAIFIEDENDRVVWYAEFAPQATLPSPVVNVSALTGAKRLRPYVFFSQDGLYAGYWTSAYHVPSSHHGYAAPCVWQTDAVFVAGRECLSHRVWYEASLAALATGGLAEAAGADAPTVTAASRTMSVTLPTTRPHSEVDCVYVLDASTQRIVGRNRTWGLFGANETTVDVYAISVLASRLQAVVVYMDGQMAVGAPVDVAPAYCKVHATPNVITASKYKRHQRYLVTEELDCQPSDLKSIDGVAYTCSQHTQLHGVTFHWSLTTEPSAGGENKSNIIRLGLRANGIFGWLSFSVPEKAGAMYPSVAWVTSSVAAHAFYMHTYQGLRDGLVMPDKLTKGMQMQRTAEGMELHLVLEASTVLAPGSTILSSNIAYHYSSFDMATKHSDYVSFVIDLSTGAHSLVDHDAVERWRNIHGWLMAIAWCWLAPLTIMAKRYGKTVFGVSDAHTLGQVGWAFRAHVLLAAMCMVCTALGALIALNYFGKEVAQLPDPHSHTIVGCVIFGMACVLPTIGVMGPLFVPKEGKSAVAFKVVHSWIGRATGVMAVVQCFTGIKRLNNENCSVLRWVSVLGVMCLCSVAFLLEFLRMAGRQLSTGSGGGRAVAIKELFTTQELLRHSTPNDPWVAIDTKIYAVKKWLKTHPGGPSVLLRSAGHDATQDFRSFRHSRRAVQKMEQFQVGTLADHSMESTIALSEGIVTSLSCLNLKEAKALINKYQNSVPRTLLTAFMRLTRNLSSYVPYLPDSFKNGSIDENTLTKEEVQEKNLRLISPVLRRIEMSPPTSCGIAFTDIPLSTQLWANHSSCMAQCVKIHNEVIRNIAADLGGYETRNVGDAFMFIFTTHPSAVSFGLNLQTKLLAAKWPADMFDGTGNSAGPSVAVAVHWGDVVSEKHPSTGRVDCFGEAVRVTAAIHSSTLGGCLAVTESLLQSLSTRDLSMMVRFEKISLGLMSFGKGDHCSRIPPTEVALVVHSALSSRKAQWFGVSSVPAKADTAWFRQHYKSTTFQENNAATPASLAPAAHPLVSRAPVTKAMLSPFRTSTGTVAFVSSTLDYLKQEPEVPSALYHFLAPMFEGALRSEGVVHSMCGAGLIVSWNLSKRCVQHHQQACAFVMQLRETWANRCVASDVLHIGTTAGRALLGKTGTESHKVLIMCGGLVELAIHVATTAQRLHALCLHAAMPRTQGLRDEPSVAPHLRPIDVWCLISHSYKGAFPVSIWELNVASLAKHLTKWGISRTEDDCFWTKQLKDLTVAAMNGDTAAAREVLPKLTQHAADGCVQCRGMPGGMVNPLKNIPRNGEGGGENGDAASTAGGAAAAGAEGEAGAREGGAEPAQEKECPTCSFDGSQGMQYVVNRIEASMKGVPLSQFFVSLLLKEEPAESWLIPASL
eukprot:Rhum_TRINITY_DN3097_c0_g1::Rhum_TRINITY_DN3097_c0_g1_i1::g.9556::m.9556